MLFGDGPKGNKFAKACVGENNIDSPPHLRDRLVKTIKVSQLGNVSLNSRNVGADCLHGIVEFLLATARDEDIRTLFDEKLCRSKSNPFCAASDDGGLAFEPFGHCRSLLLVSWDSPVPMLHARSLESLRVPNECRATSEYSRRYPRRTSCKDHAVRSRYAALPVRCPASGRGETEAAAQCRIRRCPLDREAPTNRRSQAPHFGNRPEQRSCTSSLASIPRGLIRACASRHESSVYQIVSSA